MTDDLRTRIAAVLEGYVDHGHRYDLADMLIRELDAELLDFGLWLSEELTGRPISRADLKSCLTDWKESR